MRSAVLLAFAGILAHSQSSGKLEFEVASIKPAAPQPARGGMVRMSGGPGTPSPGEITYINVTLRLMITNAFDIKAFQLTAPDWTNDSRFDVVAKVPKGATREEVRVMLQNLLADRFGMKVHHEQKEMQAFALLAAKGGVKLKSSIEAAPNSDSAPPGPLKMDRNGFPVLPPGSQGTIIETVNGQMHLTAMQRSLADICNFLGNQLSKPVIDQTGLTGKYDFNLQFAPDTMAGPGRGLTPLQTPSAGGEPGGSAAASNDPAPTLIGAVQEQLGLKLEAKKLPVDIVVIDHIEKTPTEN
jgi:uncharacterized protein (TIGR03435 family)